MNGLLLVLAIVGVSAESIQRLFAPHEISEIPVLLVALLATVLNFVTARLLVSGEKDDLNVRGAYLHMLADAAVSMAVVVGAVVMLATGWLWIDAGLSLGICVVLAIGTWGLLRDSTTMLMNAAPRALDVNEIRQALASDPQVAEVADLHVWSISTTDVLLTARLICPDLSAEQQDSAVAHWHAELRRDFEIAHATLEILHGPQTDAQCPFG